MDHLSAQHLAKKYNNRWVVSDVSFDIDAGEIVGLLGPNGAGKTTSFYMVVGLVRGDHGKIFLNNLDLTPLPIYQRAQNGLSYLPQEASVFRKLTVEENILAIFELNPTFSANERLEKTDELLEEFHLTALRKNIGHTLSGGERRRLEIARALATHPKFILLDEPFAGVDPISIDDIKQIIQTLKKKQIGVLITDHNVRETLDICERAYIIHQGKVICEGSPDIILQNQMVRKIYLGEQFYI